MEEDNSKTQTQAVAANAAQMAETGEALVAPRAERLRVQVYEAACVALLDIDDNERAALEKVKKEAGEKRGKIKKKLGEILSSSDVKVVRRFWDVRSDDMLTHFLGDQTKVGGFGSEDNKGQGV